ncbi:MAG: hypothetical protein IT315_00360 [Anaerolineales bacterium]|nr:hypothetical protein [Anaerolineales bacterium]
MSNADLSRYYIVALKKPAKGFLISILSGFENFVRMDYSRAMAFSKSEKLQRKCREYFDTVSERRTVSTGLRMAQINPRKFAHLRYSRSKALNLSSDNEKTMIHGHVQFER